MKGTQVKLAIDLEVQPVNQSHRRIPFHRRKAVDECVEQLLRDDVIEKVPGPHTWINLVVFVPKNSGKLRLCIDMREANKAIGRHRFVTPTLDDIITKMNGAKIFSKLDMNSGYQQLELHPDSRSISTFSTHSGLYRYKRLFFGVNTAHELFNETARSLLSDIPNQINISDDIIVFGSNIAEHDNALRAIFKRFNDYNVTVNSSKCEFHKSEISFFGT